jgi:hypothetical protein
VRRFPLRTLILMALALIVFARMWIITHGKQAEEAGKPPPPRPGMKVDTAPASEAPKAPAHKPAACNVLERALDGVVRNPTDGAALAEAQRLMEACPEPPVRACELGTALDVRAPLSAGASPARELLKTLCQRCPAEANACAGSIARMLLVASTGRAGNPGETLWNLENAGPGRPAACTAVVRAALVPAAVTGGKFDPALRPLLSALAPVCAKEGLLPAPMLSAAVIQQGAQAGELTGLATAPAGESTSMAPAQITGAEAGNHAFDGSEKSGVDLGNGQTPRWEADGALRAQFDPPLKQLTSVRVRAKGAGTLRAIIRTPPRVGMEDRERGTFFVNPTVCRFKGTGQWETCELKVPLLAVEALSVFPDQPKISLYEVDARGTR